MASWLLDREPRGEQRVQAYRINGKLSERVDRIEQIILDTRARLAQSESQCCQLAQEQTEIEDKVQGQQRE